MKKLTNNHKMVPVVLVAVAITCVALIFALPKPTSTGAPTTTAPAHHQVAATTTDHLATQFRTFCTTVGRVNKDLVTLEYGVVADSDSTVKANLAVLAADSVFLSTEALGLGGTYATQTDAFGHALTTDGDALASHPPSTTPAVVTDFTTSNNDIQDLYGLCVNRSGGLPPLGRLPF